MKILTQDQHTQWLNVSLTRQNLTPQSYIERSASEFCKELVRHFSPQKVSVVAGRGNNGATGLVIARILKEEGWQVESVYLLHSKAFTRYNLENQISTQSLIRPVTDEDSLPDFSGGGFIIDALLGSGINREVSGIEARLIDRMNQSERPTISVDLPSGLHPDDPRKDAKVVHATRLLSFSLPRLSFFSPEAQPYLGQISVLDIGLDPQFLHEEPTPYYLLNEANANFLETHFGVRFAAHASKWDRGHAGLLVGSEGMMGAARLCAEAALRSGVGMVSAQVPKAGVLAMQMAVPECILSADKSASTLSKLSLDLSKITALGVGPGIGLGKATEVFFEELSQKLVKRKELSLVIDGDGLNLLSNLPEKARGAFLRRGTILTPHAREFERLFGRSESFSSRLALQQKLAQSYEISLLYKGKDTAIALPNGQVFFNPTGNAGMAKGGSGDVLTGVITGLLAQGYSPEVSALLGVYVHGLSGDMANAELGERAMLPSDCIRFLGKAFSSLN